MDIDLHAKSQQLLEMLANAIYDREDPLPKPFFFSIAEVHLAEKWLRDFIKDIKKDCVCI